MKNIKCSDLSKLYLQTLTTVSILVTSLTGNSQTSSLSQMSDSKNNWVSISNSAQCAADMKTPSDSIFLAFNLRNSGIILNNLAKQTQQNQESYVALGLKHMKVKLNILSNIILQKLNRNELSMISSKNQIDKNLILNDNPVDSRGQYFESSQCYQVNQINNTYSNLFLRGISQKTLEEMAIQFTDIKTPLKCNTEQIKSDLDLYPIYNIDLKIKDQKNWKTYGFDFWQSYKIYLSWAWKNHSIDSLKASSFEKLSLLIPIEEQLMILSNGCKSVERPECNSDYISSTELRTLFSTKRKQLELSSSSLEMKDFIFENNDSLDSSIKENIAKKSGDQTWIKDFQKARLGFASQFSDYLFKANKLFGMANQIKTAKLESDLKQAVQLPENLEEAHYLCSEHRLLMHEQPLSIFKFDLEHLKTNGHLLNQYLSFGMKVNEIYEQYVQFSKHVTQACNQLDEKQINEMDSKWNNYKSWYKNFLNRYQVIKAAMEVESQEASKDEFIDQRPKNYIQGQCVNVIDCYRNFIESVVQINKVLLHSKSFLGNELISPPLFNERAEKVACQFYDPFEAAKLNKKKLWTDIGSSFLFGWTALPIYLNLNYTPSKIVSFNKLIQDGHIQFDPEFDKGQVSKTLSLSLGSFIDIPCSINISEVGEDLGSGMDSQYIYKGLSLGACQGSKHESITSPTGSVDVFRKNPEKDFQMCGQCSFNFEKVSRIKALNVFAPLRVGIMLASSLERYYNVKNNEIINPTEYTVSLKALLETYQKNNKTIPQACVPMLAKGLSCQSNICEAMAVKEFEMSSGLEVETIELGQNDRFENETAWIKAKGCKKTMRFNLRCQENGNSFWMLVRPSQYKQCQEPQ